MTTTTGSIASFGSGWGEKPIKKIENLSNIDDQDADDSDESDKEKASLSPVHKTTIKGSSPKELLVGHRERFLDGLQSFLENNLQEQQMPISSMTGATGATGAMSTAPEIKSAISSAEQAEKKSQQADQEAKKAQAKAIEIAIKSSQSTSNQAKSNLDIINSLKGIGAPKTPAQTPSASQQASQSTVSNVGTGIGSSMTQGIK